MKTRPCRSLRVMPLLMLSLLVHIAEAKQTLRIGVTLHPYYSWTLNLVGGKAEVIPLLPADVDPHTYQPQPEDIARLAAMDAVVMNGRGHDAFVEPMLVAAGRPDLLRIDLHRGVLMLPQSGSGGEKTAVNSHTFLSITSTVHQLNNLLEDLIQLDPAHAERYRDNARRYKARLRRLLLNALKELNTIEHRNITIGTVHEGYNYLLQDLGMQVQAVVQPRHGIRPSPKQLADTLRRLEASGIDILFTEMDYEAKYVDIIREETGVFISRLSHISKGKYAADTYEKQMAENLRRVVDAVRAVLR